MGKTVCGRWYVGDESGMSYMVGGIWGRRPPSPVARRLKKAPSRDTRSPRERADGPSIFDS